MLGVNFKSQGRKSRGKIKLIHCSVSKVLCASCCFQDREILPPREDKSTPLPSPGHRYGPKPRPQHPKKTCQCIHLLRQEDISTFPARPSLTLFAASGRTWMGPRKYVKNTTSAPAEKGREVANALPGQQQLQEDASCADPGPSMVMHEAQILGGTCLKGRGRKDTQVVPTNNWE